MKTKKILNEEEKKVMIEQAAVHYGSFMDIVIPGWREDSHSKDTPMRVSKSFMNDLCRSLHSEEPELRQFDNDEGYDGIIAQCNIPVRSLCQHHHLLISGIAHVGYIMKPILLSGEKTKIIGLSKLNRIVEFHSRKPQTQEHLTMQIHNHLSEVLKGNVGIAVVIHASHACTSHRGIGHDSEMHTAKLSGFFFDNDLDTRAEFYRMIDNALKLKR